MTTFFFVPCQAKQQASLPLDVNGIFDYSWAFSNILKHSQAFLVKPSINKPMAYSCDAFIKDKRETRERLERD